MFQKFGNKLVFRVLLQSVISCYRILQSGILLSGPTGILFLEFHSPEIHNPHYYDPDYFFFSEFFSPPFRIDQVL